jgi:hypothetical protein
VSSTTRTTAADNTPAEAPTGDERADERPAEQPTTPEPEPVAADKNAAAAPEVVEPGTDTTPADDDTSTRVPGSGGFDLITPIVVAGLEWLPADGDPLGAPIGTALAAEMAASA